jgi:2-succinyl-6-hydroxy-2,4-cyclohexadiene-1-carboxylate synthase
MPLSRASQSESSALVVLHGFTQTGQSAHRFRSILAGHRSVLTPDLPRHGGNHGVGGSLAEIADFIASSLPESRVDVLGYSMGGRVALHLALQHPQRIRRLVLIGATRGIADEAAREERRGRDDELATRIERIGTEAFLDEWISQPMFRDLPDDEDERRSRKGQVAESLAQSLREAGTGTQRWLGDDLENIDAPTMALAGANDPRFASEADAIAHATGGSFALIPGAGHAAHLAQPSWTAALIDAFLLVRMDGQEGDGEGDAEE